MTTDTVAGLLGVPWNVQCPALMHILLVDRPAPPVPPVIAGLLLLSFPQNAVRVPRDFEGCSVLRKYLGQLHYLQSRVPMGSGQEAAVPVTW